MTISKRSNEKLWKKIVSEVKHGSKGGKPGQWSARKAQLAVMKYKSREEVIQERKQKIILFINGQYRNGELNLENLV